MKRCAVLILLSLMVSAIFGIHNTIAESSSVNKVNSDSKQIVISEDELKTIIEDLQNNNEPTKIELYEAIIEKEKRFSENLYDFLGIFTVVVTLYVTVAGAIITVYGNRIRGELNNYQKKINDIYNSKEVDEKLNDIEERLKKIKILERNYHRDTLIKKYEEIRLDSQRIFNYIDFAKVTPEIEKVLIDEEYQYMKNSFFNNCKDFIENCKTEITEENAGDNYTMSFEEELEGLLENVIYDVEQLEKIKEKIEVLKPEHYI